MIFSQTPLFAQLLAETPFSTAELIDLIQTSPTRYKDHYIEKRNGRGKRLISQPTKEVKYVQRYLIANVLNSLPIHSAAKAYRVGLSIKDHALPHANAKYLLKLDFKDFFPSITAKALSYKFSVDLKISNIEIEIINRIVCRYDPLSDTLRLSIGSPSSPYISNYFLFDFDEKIFQFCNKNQITYTRYADDLALSTNSPRNLDIAYQHILKIIHELNYLGLNLNSKKTINVSKKNRRTLVGLTLSNDGTASIGRDAKRDIRNQLYRASKGEITNIEFQKLKGRLAFLFSVDPDFVIKLCRKHGATRVADLNFVGNI